MIDFRNVWKYTDLAHRCQSVFDDIVDDDIEVKVPVRITITAPPQYNKRNEKNFKPLYYPEIKEVLFKEPATIVFFKDGSKTVAICGEGDTYDKEVGLSVCMLKRVLGNQEYRKIMDKWCYTKEELN